MQHTNQTKFVMYLDDFLDEATLKSLQDTVTKLEYQEVKNPEGQLYGMRHSFDKSICDDPLLKLIKQYFFPHRNLEPIAVCAHLRENNKEPLFHVDDDKGSVANFQ